MFAIYHSARSVFNSYDPKGRVKWQRAFRAYKENFPTKQQAYDFLREVEGYHTHALEVRRVTTKGKKWISS